MPPHRSGMDSGPVTGERGGGMFAGMAARTSCPSRPGGCWRAKAAAVAPAFHSDLLAECRASLAAAGISRSSGASMDIRAVHGASSAATLPIRASSVVVTCADLSAAAQDDVPPRIPDGLLAKCVCSKSRPTTRSVVAPDRCQMTGCVPSALVPRTAATPVRRLWAARRRAILVLSTARISGVRPRGVPAGANSAGGRLSLRELVMVLVSRLSSQMAPPRTLPGNSSSMDTAAVTWSLARPRKSPKTAVIITTAHQPADPPGGRGAALTGGAILQVSRCGTGPGQLVVQQRPERGQALNHQVEVSARRRLARCDGAGVGRREGGSDNDGFAAIHRRVSRTHERGEQADGPIFGATGQQPDHLERVEARREDLRQVRRLPQTRLNVRGLL